MGTREKMDKYLDKLSNCIIISELLLICPIFGLVDLFMKGRGELSMFGYIALIVLCIMTIIKEVGDIIKILRQKKMIMAQYNAMLEQMEQEEGNRYEGR